MSDTIRRIAGFEGNAAGHQVSITTAASVECFVMLQAADGSAAAYVGFSGDGKLTVNCQRDGVWQEEQRIESPVRQEALLSLSLSIMNDHIVLNANSTPLLVAPLGRPADGITAALMRGSGEAAVTGGHPVHAARWETLAGTWPPQVATDRGVVLVATRWLVAAVADALTLDLPIIVAAPLPQQRAELAAHFDDALAAGRLLPLRAWPLPDDKAWTRKGAEGEPATAYGLGMAVRSAVGPIRRLYADALGAERPMVRNDLATVSEEIFEIQHLRGVGSLTDRSARRGYLRRPDVGKSKLGQPWLSTTALARLARSPLTEGLLVFIASEGAAVDC